MLKTLLIYVIVSFSFYELALCQSDKSMAVFSNEKFKFKIIRTSTNILDSNKVDLSAKLIKSAVSNTDRKRVLKLKYDDWNKLLSNEATDWATNLYLYDIYKRDASIFEIIKDRESWVKCCKEDDLNFWRKELIKSSTKQN